MAVTKKTSMSLLNHRRDNLNSLFWWWTIQNGERRIWERLLGGYCFVSHEYSVLITAFDFSFNPQALLNRSIRHGWPDSWTLVVKVAKDSPGLLHLTFSFYLIIRANSIFSFISTIVICYNLVQEETACREIMSETRVYFGIFLVLECFYI